MTKKNQKMLLAYMGIGLAFDYLLYRKNAPSGTHYSPTLRYIAAWPYYVFQAG